jgi:flagellar motility protein MotE (MotC chaperone)
MIRFSFADMTVAELVKRLALPAAAVVMLTIPGAFAQEARTAAGGDLTSEEEIKQFCSNIADPTDIYKKMKPDAAAQQLQQVKIEVAAAVIMRLNASQSSLILNEMDPQKAAVIANIIASASDPNTSKDPS